MWKTIIVIWTDFDPLQLELSDLAREAECGDAYCSKQHVEKIEDWKNDVDAPAADFFDTMDVS